MGVPAPEVRREVVPSQGPVAVDAQVPVAVPVQGPDRQVAFAQDVAAAEAGGPVREVRNVLDLEEVDLELLPGRVSLELLLVIVSSSVLAVTTLAGLLSLALQRSYGLLFAELLLALLGFVGLCTALLTSLYLALRLSSARLRMRANI